jgi:RIO-like serine/threonine protein kinase
MVNLLDGAQESEILEWIKGCIKNRSNIYSHGYQGQTYIFEGKRQRFIIKAPSGWGLAKLIRRWMLRNEYRVYTKLSGLKGIPVCYGFIDGRYLVLEFIGGTPIRSARIADPGRFFELLLNLIKEIHHLGVAHTDLKKKDNILVVDGKTPYVVDFGVAVVRNPGFAPLNHYLYKLAKKFDYNAWAKLKYNRKLKYISEQDRQYYDRTFLEKASRRIKRMYRSVKSRFEGHP